jgi:hypothetical protein
MLPLERLELFTGDVPPIEGSLDPSLGRLGVKLDAPSRQRDAIIAIDTDGGNSIVIGATEQSAAIWYRHHVVSVREEDNWRVPFARSSRGEQFVGFSIVGQ